MSDNIVIADKDGAARTVATDQISGVDWQRVKTAYGAEGAATEVTDTSPLPVTTVPLVHGTDSVEAMAGVRTAGGVSVYRLLAAGTTNAQCPKASAGQVYGWHLFNAAAYPVFLKLYNKASAPSVGSDTPVLTVGLSAGATANVAFPWGIPFTTGIALAITKLVADADTTAVTANDLALNLLLK